MDVAAEESGWVGVSAGDEHGRQRDARREGGAFAGLRRVEVITGTDRRRRWTDEEKASITAESFAPGSTVSGVARRHSMSLGLLYYWRRCARHGVGARVSFVPVLPAEGSGVIMSDPLGRESFIEIEVCDARIRLGGAIDGVALRTVIAAVRGA
jgi:transposase